jgi:hypothetical protein
MERRNAYTTEVLGYKNAERTTCDRMSRDKRKSSSPQLWQSACSQSLDHSTRLILAFTWLFTLVELYMLFRTRLFKADSHIPCRSHAVRLPFPYHAVLLSR